MNTKIVTPQQIIDGEFKLNIDQSRKPSQYGAIFIDILMKIDEQWCSFIIKETDDVITLNTPYKNEMNKNIVSFNTARIAWSPSPLMKIALETIDTTITKALKSMNIKLSNSMINTINNFNGFKLIQTTRIDKDTNSIIALNEPIMRCTIPYSRNAKGSHSDDDHSTWISIKNEQNIHTHPKLSEINNVIPRGSRIRLGFSLGPIVLSTPNNRDTVSIRNDIQGIVVIERSNVIFVNRAEEITDLL
jgi:hypothetical protein